MLAHWWRTCNHLAPYLFQVVDKDWERLGIPEDHTGRLELPLFRSLPGYCWHGADGNDNELCIKPGERILVYEGKALEILLARFGYSPPLADLFDYDGFNGYEFSFWHLSAVYAP
jgi:hypothetical protein